MPKNRQNMFKETWNRREIKFVKKIRIRNDCESDKQAYNIW